MDTAANRTMDLIAQHYFLRTENVIFHSKDPMRFTDGQGMSWLFLDTPEDPVQGKGEGGEVGQADTLVQDYDAEIIRRSIEYISILGEHCASPSWSINIAAPELTLHAIRSTKTISFSLDMGESGLEWMESMILDSTAHSAPNASGGRSTEIVRADPNKQGDVVWEIRDGRGWFVSTFPELAKLVQHEEVWVAVKKRQDEEEDTIVGGYITTLSDTKRDGSFGGDKTPRGRVYISDLLVFPEYRRKGLGRALLRNVITRARESEDRPLVCLTVFCSNAGASAMYLAEGFTVERKLVVIRST